MAKRFDRPDTMSHSAIPVRSKALQLHGEPDYIRNPSLLDGYLADVAIEIDGVMKVAQHCITMRGTEVAAHDRIEAGNPRLTPLELLAVRLDRERRVTIRNSDGSVKRRGLTGDMLYLWVASQLIKHGYSDMTADEVVKVLNGVGRKGALIADLALV